MDFRSRGVQSPITPAPSSSSSGENKQKNMGKWLERGSLVLLAGITILIIAVVGLLLFGAKGQAGLLDKDKFQAVFLNNGQVYFGNIKGLNKDYVELRNIYYLQTNSNGESAQNTNTNVTLVKLGCELHAPFDQMVINSEQVLFWENLQDNSEVVKKIGEYKKSNPEGKCSPAASGSTEQATPNAGTQSTSPANETQQQPANNSGSGSGSSTTNPRRP